MVRKLSSIKARQVYRRRWTQLRRRVHDVVVVGGGIAGLAAALYLAKKGREPLVVEKNPQVGGYAVNFYRGPYRFDGSLFSVNGGLVADGAMATLLDRLGLAGAVDFIPLQTYHQLFDQRRGETYTWALSPDLFVEEWVRRYPAEEAGLRAFFEMAFKMGEFLSNWAAAGAGQKFLKSFAHLGSVPVILKYIRKSARELLEDYLSDARLVAELLGFPGFCGTPPDQLSAIVYFSSFFEKFVQGATYVKGGSGALTQAMGLAIQRHGGVLLLNHAVTGVHVHHGRVTRLAVRATQRERPPVTLRCRNVVFCADPRQLFGPLGAGSAFPANFQAQFINRPVVESLFEVFVGLDVDLAALGYPNYTNTFLRPDGRELYAVVYSNVDPSCCPSGHANVALLAYTDITRFQAAVDRDGGTRGTHYRALKDRLARELLAEFCTATGIPALADHVQTCIAATPVTYRRYTNNYRGSISGFACSFRHSIRHPIPVETPLANLFLASQWTGIGGGYQLCLLNGIHAGRAIHKRLKKTRDRLRVKVVTRLDEDPDEAAEVTPPVTCEKPDATLWRFRPLFVHALDEARARDDD